MGLDISPDTEADIVADLDDFPYPIESDSFDEILCQDVIEHVASPVQTMTELHRIGRPGARVLIRTPHFSSMLAYSDPTHRHYFSSLAVRGLAVPGFAHYTAARFRVVALRLYAQGIDYFTARGTWPRDAPAFVDVVKGDVSRADAA